MVDPQKVQSIFDALLATPSIDRDDELAGLCANDSDLAAEVRSLLRCHSMMGSFLDSPVAPATIVQSGGLQPGDMIGVFELEKLIGEGAYGQVYVGHQHEPIRRKVAVKLLRPGLTSEKVLARFLAEQQVLAMLDHPHIAKIIDVGGKTGDQAYFVMELVDGVPINQYCDDMNLTLEKRLELFAAVCGAIQHAHHKGVIHRDLKPSNILVSCQDGRHSPKIIDFGIAKTLIRPLSESLQLTRKEQVVGTPLYMSPEQAQKRDEVDSRSDVYSLGVVLYELLTGTTPLTAEQLRDLSFDELCEMVARKTPPKPSTRLTATSDTIVELASLRNTTPIRLSNFIRGDLDWIVMRALEKEPKRRYQNPDEFSKDLNRFLNHEAVIARPPSRIYLARKFVRKNFAACVAALLILVSLVGSSIFSSRQAAIAEKARDEASAARQAEMEKRLNAEVVQDLLLDSFRKPHPGVSGMDLRVAEVLVQAVDAIEKDDRLPVASKIELLHTLGKTLEGLDLRNESNRVLKILVPLASMHLGQDDELTLECRLALGWGHVSCGEYDEAIRQVKLLQSKPDLSREFRIKVLRLNHRANWKKGNWQEARRCEKEILRLHQGNELNDAAALAAMYQSQQRIPDLIATRESEYERTRKAEGPGELGTVLAALQLVGAYRQDANRRQESAEFLRNVIPEARAKLGDEHPYLLRLNMSLSYALLTVNPDEAVRIARDTVRNSAERLGAANTETLGAELNLVRCLTFTTRFDEADELCRNAIERSASALGENHLRTLNLELFHCICQKLRDEKQSQKVTPKTLAATEALYAKCRTNRPKESITTRFGMCLASVHSAMGEEELGVQVLEELWQSFDQRDRESNPNLSFFGMFLACAYTSTPRIDDAIDQFENCVQPLFGTLSPKLPELFLNFSNALVDAEEFELAYEYAIRGKEFCNPDVRSKTLVELTTNAGESMRSIALEQDGQEQNDSLRLAIKYFEEIFQNLPDHKEKMPYVISKKAKCAARLTELYENLEITEAAQQWGRTQQELAAALADPEIARKIELMKRFRENGM